MPLFFPALFCSALFAAASFTAACAFFACPFFAAFAAFICFSYFSYALFASRRRCSYISSKFSNDPRYCDSLWSCRWMMSVVTELKKSRSCDTTNSVFFHRIKYSSSQITARKSRWFVGSSSNKHVGSMNSARAKEMRMRQPPENDLVVLCMLNRSGPDVCFGLRHGKTEAV
jgi:hypothetical protein